MRLFSHRKRSAAAGPLPTELLPRLALGSLDATTRLPDSPPAPATPGEWGVAHVFDDIVDVFTACRTGDVLAAPAPMPSVGAAVDNMRGYCFFLDADLAGICEPSPGCWTAEPIEGHRNAIAIIVGHGRPIRPGEPGYDWISGAQSMRAYLRASVIANALAAQIRRLGYAAQAHTAADDEINHIPLLLSAGIGELCGSPASTTSWVGERSIRPRSGGSTSRCSRTLQSSRRREQTSAASTLSASHETNQASHCSRPRWRRPGPTAWPTSRSIVRQVSQRRNKRSGPRLRESVSSAEPLNPAMRLTPGKSAMTDPQKGIQWQKSEAPT